MSITRPLCSPPCWRVRQLQRWTWERVGRGKLLLRCRLLVGARRFGAHGGGEERGEGISWRSPAPTACYIYEGCVCLTTLPKLSRHRAACNHHAVVSQLTGICGQVDPCRRTRTVEPDLQPHNLGLNSAWQRALQNRWKWRQLVRTAMRCEIRAPPDDDADGD